MQRILKIMLQLHTFRRRKGRLFGGILRQFAQCLRLRNLQYITELEKNVYALQAEGSEVCAEVEYLNQTSLKNLAQEQLIKYSNHER
nr:hypothetical protein [Tanacetum cinerariifolium]